MSGILKYMKASTPNLFWGRASYDGVPFRGAIAPMLREEEYEVRAIRVCDAKVRTFDMSEPDDAAAYRDVLDRVMNGWYTITHTQRNWDPDKKCMIVYVEWVEQYMEDSRTYMPGART